MVRAADLRQKMQQFVTVLCGVGGMFVAIRGMNSVEITGDSPQFLTTKCDESVLLTSADNSKLTKCITGTTEPQLTIS